MVEHTHCGLEKLAQMLQMTRERALGGYTNMIWFCCGGASRPVRIATPRACEGTLSVSTTHEVCPGTSGFTPASGTFRISPPIRSDAALVKFSSTSTTSDRRSSSSGHCTTMHDCSKPPGCWRILPATSHISSNSSFFSRRTSSLYDPPSVVAF